MLISREKLPGILKSLGPGLLWAGAAIGVSHLVQSTRAGAGYGFALVWVVLVANLLKYPFFEFGPRYAAATGESLLDGYRRLGWGAVALFLVLTFGTMFTVLAAVTIVTAGLASQVFGGGLSAFGWSAVVLVVCMLILIPGKYPLLDRLMKVVIILLSVSTLVAVVAALIHGPQGDIAAPPPPVWTATGVAFLVALMGWMPSAFDIAVWHSLWTLERRKETCHKPLLREALFDFNLGYIGTAFLALVFLTLGALVMYATGREFAGSAPGFARLFIQLYTRSLGSWSRPVILMAAFTTMFSTTLTVTDAFPRVLRRSTEIVFPSLKGRRSEWLYWTWMLVIASGALLILGVFIRELTVMVDLATTLSFLTAPVLGYMNLKVVTGPAMPPEAVPPRWLRILSWTGLTFLTGFSVLFLVWRFVL